MKHEAKTAAEAIAKMQRTHAIDGTIPGGTYYVRENPNAHPLRRFGACYVKGDGERAIQRNGKLIDGIYHIED